MKFKKTYLLGEITKNRKQHREIFEEAIEGYRKKAVEELNAHIERIKRGEVIAVRVYYPQPEDHTKDYDRLLEMIKMTTEDEINLTETQFAQYVQDDWSWKHQFLTTNSSYSDMARKELGEDA